MFLPILSHLPYQSLRQMEQQTFMGRINYARRLLLHSPLHKTPDSLTPYSTNRRFDSHIVLILSILLCVLVACLVLNSIIRCALRCLLRPPTATNELVSATPATATNMGLKKKALEMFPMVSYSGELRLRGLASECVICLSDFVDAEMVRVLPKCNHGFHVKCIDQWLESHSSCPTCRRCLLATCKKVVGLPDEPDILPLENEGFVRQM